MIVRSRPAKPDYDWEVFLSYKRAKSGETDWVRKIVLGRLRTQLEAISTEARIGIDEDFIEAGDVWPKKLRRALARSRVLVAFVSAAYFNSKWCRRELAIMMERHQYLSQNSKPTQYRFIVPVRLDNDGKSFPPIIKNVQGPLFGDFFPQNCNRRLVHELKALAQIIRQRIAESPEWDSSWKRLSGNPYFRKLRPISTIQRRNPRLVVKIKAFR